MVPIVLCKFHAFRVKPVGRGRKVQNIGRGGGEVDKGARRQNFSLAVN